LRGIAAPLFITGTKIFAPFIATMKQPQLSVILPVYNAAKYLQETIDAVLAQSFTDFEFIIINDGSSDNSQAIIDSYTDPRIVKVVQSNQGLAATLNNALQLAKADLIARQDNDDISYPDRFQKQVAFLNAHPNIAVLGTSARIVDEKGHASSRFHRHPTDVVTLRYLLLFDNPFAHASVMFRKAAVLEAGGYDKSSNYFEDHRLWSKLSQKHELANLPEVLIDYREVATGMSKSANDYSQKVINQSLENIETLLPQNDKQTIIRFITQSRGEGPFNDLSKDYRLFLKYLADLTESFSKRYGYAINTIKPAEARIKRQFLRSYYNTVINNQQSSFYKKLMARIKRRLLITMFGL
jgi:glycosyltransferase involved in cell wall biosynthesis